MTVDNLANWAFAYVLIGGVAWALLFAGGVMDKAFEESRVGAWLASVGIVFGWPVLAFVFFKGMGQEAQRRRRARP